MIRTTSLLFVCLFAVPAVAGTRPRPSSARARDERSDARRAADLLVELFAATAELPERNDRVLLAACLAGALWPYDAERASGLARRAFDRAGAGVVGDDEARVRLTRWDRESVLTVTRAHDPALARRFAAEMVNEVSAIARRGGPLSAAEVDRLLTVAEALVDDDLPASARLTRHVLDGGAAPGRLLTVLFSIWARDAALGNSLVRATIEVRRASGASVFDFESLVFPPPRYLQVAPPELSFEETDPETARVYLEAQLAYLDKADGGSLAFGENGSATRLLPAFDRFDPARSGEARRVVARLRGPLPFDFGSWAEREHPPTNGQIISIDKVITANVISVTPSVSDDTTLARDSEYALQTGRPESAREIGSRIRDADLRNRSLDAIASSEMWTAEYADRPAGVLTSAAKIDDPLRRADAIGKLAASEPPERRVRAIELFELMHETLTSRGAPFPPESAVHLAAYARALAPVDAGRGFAILAEAAQASNRPHADVPCGARCGVDCTSELDVTYALYAAVDFDRAVAVARSIRDPYDRFFALRGAATGALRESAKVLDAPPKT